MKLIKNKNYQCFYVKEELYEIGITEMKIEIALFTDAMKRCADRKDRNSIKLHKYAKIFNIENELRKYLEVLLR